MKLFVDDIRKCPEGWHLARTVTEAIRVLSTIEAEEVSLDHDIACYLVDGHQHTSGETFEPVARYLATMKKEWERENPDVDSGLGWDMKVTFHTSNYEAGRKMADILGLLYKPRWYPAEFVDGHCECHLLPEDEEKPCDYCERYKNFVGEYPGATEKLVKKPRF